VYGFDTRAASCARVLPGKVPPAFDRFCVEGEREWGAVVRGDLAPEPEPEGPAAAPGLWE
jgi:hypothetical protein